MTNNHVLPNSQDATFSQIQFNYQEGIDNQILSPLVFDLDPQSFFLTNKALDFSLVAVKDPNNFLQTFGFNKLIQEQGKVLLGESLNIIQHPNGDLKQLALRENLLIDIHSDFLTYHTDTAPGSSGSPVYNDQWELVGLHHSGVPKRDNNGNILARDGSIWRQEMGEHQIDWTANEGIRISSIAAYIKAQSFSGTKVKLRNEMFDESAISASPSTTFANTSDKIINNSSLPTINDNGAATWTIPVQISIKVGNNSSSFLQPQNSSNISPIIIPTTQDPELISALRALEDSRTRTYYDKDKDNADRDSYYQHFSFTDSEDEMYKSLGKLLTQTHTNKLNYKPATQVYPWVDLHPDYTLHSIYSNSNLDPEEIIREDFRIEQEIKVRLRELSLKESFSLNEMKEQLDLLEASLPFNCEHVVPQSWFQKKEPMRGDLHHLFACEPNCNSFRGNIPYFDFTDFGETIKTDCGKREGNKFEPSSGKGAVARATLYFLVRYPGHINKNENEYTINRLNTLINWHKEFPPSLYDKHRNAAIFEKQGNRNPFIDFPDLVEKINFTLGLGA